MYKSIDGKWITLVASSDAIIKRLCNAIEQSEWINDPKFSSNPNRCIHVNEIDEGITQWFSCNTFDNITKIFDGAVIPYTKVYDISDVITDPQVIFRKGIIHLTDDALGTIPAPARVPRVPGILDANIKTGPNTGEDNLSFYKELGLTENDIIELQKNKII